MEYLSDITIMDCGDVDGARYQIDAVVAHPDDTGRVATMHVASCFTREMAEQIVSALTLQMESVLATAATQQESGNSVQTRKG